jgi:hypothetical protein
VHVLIVATRCCCRRGITLHLRARLGTKASTRPSTSATTSGTGTGGARGAHGCWSGGVVGPRRGGH